ncbi:MAG: transcription termination factor Rho [Clostridia bacterium]|nr:transcription termination factor Rho [Clostridia bacterium]
MERIEWNDITRQSLENNNIFGLRDIARRAGVNSPTIMKKELLVEAILKVKEGIPPQPPQKRGSKPRTISAVKEDYDDSEQSADKVSTEALETEPIKPEESQAQAPATPTEPEITVAPVKESETAQPEYPNRRTYVPQQSRPNGQRPRIERKPFGEEDVSLEGCEERSGILEILPDGYGFLRADNFRNSPKDSYVSAIKIRKLGLRAGDYIKGYCKISSEGKPPAIVSITTVNGKDLSNVYNRKNFDTLIPIFPNNRLRLEIPGIRNELAVRAIDLISPIGKGQRAMVVSPPKAGKTTLLKMIANSISVNYPEVRLMVLLIDERPEEVTDMQRSIKGEVIYSTFDEESDNHIKVAELVLARAKRLVEEGEDVVILLDSLTRMARANNVIVPSSGKTLSGGVDPVSLYFPKRFFGAARNIEYGGSLTIIATALIDTGSRMDDIVYEEFKGTGNMEIHLDRKLSEKRIFPAIDLLRSGTRKEELLLSQKELEGAYAMRRLLSAGDTQETAETIINVMTKTLTNDDFIAQINMQLMGLRKQGFRL